MKYAFALIVIVFMAVYAKKTLAYVHEVRQTYALGKWARGELISIGDIK